MKRPYHQGRLTIECFPGTSTLPPNPACLSHTLLHKPQVLPRQNLLQVARAAEVSVNHLKKGFKYQFITQHWGRIALPRIKLSHTSMSSTPGSKDEPTSSAYDN
jgi:hypothetical protein